MKYISIVCCICQILMLELTSSELLFRNVIKHTLYIAEVDTPVNNVAEAREHCATFNAILAVLIDSKAIQGLIVAFQVNYGKCCCFLNFCA